MPEITVIGSSTFDIKIQAKQTLLPGITIRTDNINVSAGGPGRNIAEGLARLGQSVTLLSIVGDDILSQMILKATQDAGVNISHVRQIQNHKLPVFLAFSQNTEDEPLIAYNDSVYQYMDYHYLLSVSSVLNGASVIIIDGARLDVLNRIRKDLYLKDDISIGVIVKRESAIDAFKEGLGLVNTFFLNTDEASQIYGKPIKTVEQVFEVGRYINKSGIPECIITMNNQGIVFCSTKETFHMRSYNVSVVDSVGAGDSFIAGFYAARNLNKSNIEACTMGAAVAAFSVMSNNTIPNNLDIKEVYQLMVSQQLEVYHL